jgi:hypothetical protein
MMKLKGTFSLWKEGDKVALVQHRKYGKGADIIIGPLTTQYLH